MQALRKFEIQAIHILSEGILSDSQISALREDSLQAEYEYTGCGYFLTVTQPSFPVKRRILSEPTVVGTSGKVQAGFIVILENKELTLECFTLGEIEVPINFRDLDVVINTPPINSI